MADAAVVNMPAQTWPNVVAADVLYVVQVAGPTDQKITAAEVLGDGTSILERYDGANIRNQRNGANAQTKRISNTDDGAGNFERLEIGWAANLCTIKPTNGGTGVARLLSILATGSNANQVLIGSNAGTGIVCPNANDVAISAINTLMGYADGNNGGLSIGQWDLRWSSSVAGFKSTGTVGLRPTAAGVKVLGVTDGQGGFTGWLQNSAGEAALNASFTNATVTLNATNLSLTLIAGRSYRIDGVLLVSDSTAGEGWAADFNGGTATATTFQVAITTMSGTETLVVTSAAALATALTCSSVTGTNYVRVSGYIKCNAAGTLVLRFAQNSHATGTATLAAGSWIALRDTINL